MSQLSSQLTGKEPAVIPAKAEIYGGCSDSEGHKPGPADAQRRPSQLSFRAKRGISLPMGDQLPVLQGDNTLEFRRRDSFPTRRDG